MKVQCTVHNTCYSNYVAMLVCTYYSVYSYFILCSVYVCVSYFSVKECRILLTAATLQLTTLLD